MLWAIEHHHHASGLLGGVGPVMVCVIVLAFVFVECAFIIGLFLPGDSLLFTAGVVLSDRHHMGYAWFLSASAVGVAVAGNLLGYYLGRQTGSSLLGRQGGRMLTPERLDRARMFLNQHGWWSVVLARWMPWVRTLAPLIAGACRMSVRRFTLGTSIGAVLWVPALVLGGFYGGGLLDLVPWLKTTATVVSVAFFVVGTAAGVWRYRQEMSRPAERVTVTAGD